MSGTYNGGDFNNNGSNRGLGITTYYDQSQGRWIDSGDNRNHSSSDSSGGATTTTTTISYIGVSSQTFRVTCWGLKPDTQHFAYLLTTNVSSDCAPITAVNANTTYVQGNPLITDDYGRLVFDYFFKPQNSPYDTKTPQGSTSPVAIIPVGQQAFKVASSDGTSYSLGSIESKPTAAS